MFSGLNTVGSGVCLESTLSAATVGASCSFDIYGNTIFTEIMSAVYNRIWGVGIRF